MRNEYFIARHGTTEGNEKGMFMGMLDVPLNGKGVAEAVGLRDVARSLALDIAYLSPLSRAFHTGIIALGVADPVAHEDGGFHLVYRLTSEVANSIPLVVEPRIAERSFGDLQGEIKEGYEGRHPKYRDRNVHLSYNDKADGGESFSDLQERVWQFLAELDREHESKRIVIFTHNGPMRVMRRWFDGLTEAQTVSSTNPHGEFAVFNR